MTDTTKTEALRLADSLERAHYEDGDIELEAATELRRLDKIEGIADEQLDQLHRQAIRLSAVESERDRLRAVLAASCDEERSQIWEAGPGGGCMRALEAESERDRLAAECEALRADAERYRAIKASLYAENIPIGEAYLTLRVVGTCPDVSEWDAAIDAAMGGKGHRGSVPPTEGTDHD